MRSLILGLLLVLGLQTIALAQRSTIEGTVVDSLGAPLPGATVMLLRQSDSTLVSFAASGAQGTFMLRNVAVGAYHLKSSFVGYATVTVPIVMTQPGESVHLEPLLMVPKATQLDGVTVESEVTPVVVKRDTIEYNASAFKVQTNANVEDLLKKLPGVEVDNDGNVTAQGEEVQQVTVDGKNFFGRDPKIATRNLPADAIDKVQVFDKRSDQATFTGIDDGERTKTINLELKEEKRNGIFGKLTGGVGTEGRYTGRASLNKFTKGRQLSLLAMGNNTNDMGFSIDDYMNFTGGSQMMMGGGGNVRLTFSSDGNDQGVPLSLGNRSNGLMNSYAAGLNLNQDIKKNSSISGSYFFNYLDHQLDQSTWRENFLPNGNSYLYEDRSTQDNTNNNHKANLVWDHSIDSANSIKLTSTFTYNQTSSYSSSASVSQSSDDVLLNESERENLSNGDSYNSNSSLLVRHRFNKKGRTLSANLTVGVQQQEQDGELYSYNQYYGDDPFEETLNQSNAQRTTNVNYSGTLALTEALGKRRYVEGKYTYRENRSDVERNVYDVANDQYTLNPLLSNQYEADYHYHRGEVNFKLNRDHYVLTAGAAYQATNLKGEMMSTGTEIQKSFQSVLPSLRFNYDFSNSTHFRFDYETVMQEPNIQELQPVIDNSNPLNQYVGNPDLRPAYRHNAVAHFMTFDPATFVSFVLFAEAQVTTDAIVNARNVNDQLQTITTPVNVDQSTSLRLDGNFSFPITAMKTRFSVGANLRDSRSATMLNDQLNTIDQKRLGGSLRMDYSYKEVVNVGFSSRLSKQVTSYEWGADDQAFRNATVSGDATLAFLKNYETNASIEYQSYRNKQTGFDQGITMLNASVSRFMFKNKAGELRISVNNLLDQALGVSQTASINYQERVIANSLGRYFMISFIYSLNKQLNPMSLRPRGGMMMRVIRD